MSFCIKASQTAEEYSKDALSREKKAVSLSLGGPAFQVPPKEAQSGIALLIPESRALRQLNTKIWC